jgi:hypothetical protein
MPVLHLYKTKKEFYILTSIRGNIITFHLTSAGINKLLKAGIIPGKPFSRALLLDLYRTGEVFTYGTGPSEIIDERQMVLDFSNESDSEKMFPTCANCSSLQDLHLVEVLGKDHFASILCAGCRTKKIVTFDTSIPLPLVTRATLISLTNLKGIKKLDASAKVYKKLLDAEFESKWKAYRKGKPEQALLFDIDTGNQGRLI